MGSTTTSAAETAWIFGRLGLVGFGGPVALIAMMEEEICRKRGWLSAQEFATLFATCKVLPGSIAPQMAIALGRHRSGTLGGLAAGLSFITPSFLIILALSILYAHVPREQAGGISTLLGGFQAGALAVIFLSTWHLGKAYRRLPSAWIIGLISAAIIGWRPGLEPWIIAGFGLAGAWRTGHAGSGVRLHVHFLTFAALFWVCFKAGAFVFGSGLAIVPLLESDVVQRLGWLTHSEFMDGLALGQITPGPVVITSTFIGHRVAGVAGAAVATTAMFLPGFINMLWLVPRLWARMNRSQRAQGFASWAIPAVIGGIAATAGRLAWITIDSPSRAAVLAMAGAGLLLFHLPAWLVIPLSGGLAILLSWLNWLS